VSNSQEAGEVEGKEKKEKNSNHTPGEWEIKESRRRGE